MKDYLRLFVTLFAIAGIFAINLYAEREHRQQQSAQQQVSEKLPQQHNNKTS